MEEKRSGDCAYEHDLPSLEKILERQSVYDLGLEPHAPDSGIEIAAVLRPQKITPPLVSVLLRSLYG